MKNKYHLKKTNSYFIMWRMLATINIVLFLYGAAHIELLFVLTGPPPANVITAVPTYSGNHKVLIGTRKSKGT